MGSPTPPRRFPPPWTVHRGEGSYWVEDAAGRRFGFVYFTARALIGTGGEAYQTEDEARRLVTGFAKLPSLLGHEPE